MARFFILIVWMLLFSWQVSAQGGPPWNNPLNIAWSSDGISFNSPAVFQDSAGVPSVIRWKGDTLIAAFQWFRGPNPSPTWDKVALKFSYDNGITWTQPTPAVFNGLPTGFQRPFDPTLTSVISDSLRMYFSSSDGIPQGGLDSTVNTYSATSVDGINYFFELNPRVDVSSNRVIDPAVIYFNNGWHYLAPIGAPQQGAYHYVSPDGLVFSPVPNIPSDNQHNWTGNYMLESSTELRFYGSGSFIWYNQSPNGGMWTGYTDTNIQGGDPTVLKVSSGNYLMIYVGQPYTTSTQDLIQQHEEFNVYPNPADNTITLTFGDNLLSSVEVRNLQGQTVLRIENVNNYIKSIDVSSLLSGVYFISLVKSDGVIKSEKLMVY